MGTRWALGLEYDGSAYYGWQSQKIPILDTVQQQVERALSAVADVPLQVVCAGRTDRGVHALGQVVHFDTVVHRPPLAWVAGSNRFLPADIKVLWAQPVAGDFHARYTANARRYCYLIANQAIRPALLRHQVTWHPAPLATDDMQIAANYLLGEHDFSAFRGAQCQAKSAVRQVQHVQVQRQGNIIKIDIQANAFLHHMVRNIVGVLLEIGMGKREPVWAKQVLQSGDRKQAGVTAEPNGLYLAQIYYPRPWNFPTSADFGLLPVVS